MGKVGNCFGTQKQFWLKTIPDTIISQVTAFEK